MIHDVADGGAKVPETAAALQALTVARARPKEEGSRDSKQSHERVAPFSGSVEQHTSMKGDERSKTYLGVIIEQSLNDPTAGSRLNIVARKQPRDWIFLLAEAAEEDLDRHVRVLQENMEDGWYAHYFRDQELVVVYKDVVFHVTIDPGTWEAVIQHGLAKGIPLDQLDFVPNTRADAETFFDSTESA